MMHICIDPGHGGSESGAMFGKYVEKDINLVVALKVQEILTAQGQVKVTMTRESDTYVSCPRQS